MAESKTIKSTGGEPKVVIEHYYWAGKWGPFEIKTHCAECDLTNAILDSLMKKEFKGKPVQVEVKPWLNHWIYCIFRITWHPPIVIVNGKRFFNHSHKDPLIHRDKLKDYVLKLLKA